MLADGTAGDLVTALLNSSTLTALAVVIVLLTVAMIARRLWPEWVGGWTIATGGVALVVMALTQLPARQLSDADVAWSMSNALTWPADGIDISSTFASAGWWLNIVLFIPLGLCIRGLLQRRSLWWSVVTLAGAAFVVESAQAFTGFRSADLADLATNVLGGLLGCLLLPVWRSAVSRLVNRTGREPARLAIATTVLALITAAVLSSVVLVESANRAQRSLQRELESQYGSSSLETMNQVFYSSTDDAAFEQFLSASSVRPDSVVRTTDPDAVRVRFADQYFGLHRCVFVTWQTNHVSFQARSGEACTEFLGS